MAIPDLIWLKCGGKLRTGLRYAPELQNNCCNFQLHWLSWHVEGEIDVLHSFGHASGGYAPYGKGYASWFQIATLVCIWQACPPVLTLVCWTQVFAMNGIVLLIMLQIMLLFFVAEYCCFCIKHWLLWPAISMQSGYLCMWWCSGAHDTPEMRPIIFEHLHAYRWTGSSQLGVVWM